MLSRDHALIFAGAGLRATAVGLCGVILALHLATQGFAPTAIGLAVSLGLGGCALGTILVTFLADRYGRRTSLALVSFLMAAGGVVLASTTLPSVMLLSILIGMINGMGRDRGAGLTVEQAILPSTTTDAGRTRIFAWYNVVVDAGHAAGSLLGGLPALLRDHAGLAIWPSYQWTWAVYSLLCLAAGIQALRLSRAVELTRSPVSTTPLSPATRAVVVRWAALSGLDSLGGGFLTSALLGYWFFRRFGVDESLLGPLFFAVRVLNGVSHLGAAWLATRIGLVNTMVWTHLPSSVLLMTVPVAPNLTLAVALFLIREALVEMDVPTRQSYIMAVVPAPDRTRAAGIANLTRSIAWAVSPVIAGGLMRISLSAPLVVGPAMKVAYDVLLFHAFRHLKPPEEWRIFPSASPPSS